MLPKMLATLGFAAFFSLPSFAQVELAIPDNVNLVVVNQDKPDIESSFLGGDKTVTLDNGVIQIVFQYVPTFVDRDDVKKISGQYVIATFESADSSLSFDLPRFRNERQAEKEIANLNWGLKDSEGNFVSIKEDTLDINGVTLGRDYIRDVEKYNKTGGVAAVITTTSHFETPEIQPSNLTQMEFLQQQYLKMSEQDRKAFLQWAIAQ